MANTRKSLAARLQVLTDRDQELHHSLIQSVHSWADKGNITRMFDEFPVLLAESDHTKLVEQFTQIFMDAELIDPVEFEVDATTKTRLDVFFTRLAALAASEILMTHRQIKPELIGLLDLNDYNLNIEDALCAYVGAATQIIQKPIENAIKQKPELYTALSRHYNKYREYVQDILDKSARTINRLAGEIGNPLPKRPKSSKSKQIDTTDVVIAGGAAALTAFGFFMLVKASTSGNGPDATPSNGFGSP